MLRDASGMKVWQSTDQAGDDSAQTGLLVWVRHDGFNPVALGMTKTLWSSECDRVKVSRYLQKQLCQNILDSLGSRILLEKAME